MELMCSVVGGVSEEEAVVGLVWFLVPQVCWMVETGFGECFGIAGGMWLLPSPLQRMLVGGVG